MGKDGEDQLARSCEKWRSITKRQGGEEYLTNNGKEEGYWIGHILRRNCFLKLVSEGNIERMMEVMGRIGRRRKQLLYDLEETRVTLEIETGSTRSHSLKNWLWENAVGLSSDRLLNEKCCKKHQNCDEHLVVYDVPSFISVGRAA